MRLNKILALSTLLLLFGGAAQAADTYQIDPVHSTVNFAVKHLVINTVRGNFTEFSGKIVYDEADITKSSVDVTIKAASVNTGNDKRDTHLRSAEFLDAQKYPEILFKSKEIKKEGDGYVVVGDLTLHGVTREVSFPFQILGKIKDPWGKTRIGLEASLTINRQDFGVSWSQTMDNGGLMVGNDVKIELNVEAVKE